MPLPSDMKVIVLTLAIAVAVYALPVDDDGSNMTWEEFKNMYNKKYMSEEEELTRMEIFESNKQYVKVHNMNKDKHGFEVAINEFCDLVSCGVRRKTTHCTLYDCFPFQIVALCELGSHMYPSLLLHPALLDHILRLRSVTS